MPYLSSFPCLRARALQRADVKRIRFSNRSRIPVGVFPDLIRGGYYTGRFPADGGEDLLEKAWISIVNVTKKFGDLEAVKDVSLRMESGEFFTLLGPSGCGKTTLLRSIAGFNQPDHGEIYFGNETGR